MRRNGEDGGQCGTTGAAGMAQEAGVKKLGLVHMGPGLTQQTPYQRARSKMERVYQ